MSLWSQFWLIWGVEQRKITSSFDSEVSLQSMG